MNKLIYATAAAAMAALVAGPVMADNSKATADISTLVGCSFDSSQVVDLNCQNIFTGAAVNQTADSFVTVMETDVKLSASQSLFVSPSLVTGLYTATKVKGNNNSTPSVAVAMGGVYLRAILTDSDGNVVIAEPVASCTAAILGCHETTAGDTGFGVTLDTRIQSLTALLSSCLTTNGPTIDCNTSEFVQLVLQTTSAHTFNFIFASVGQGQYHLEIQAAVNSDATASNGGVSVAAAAFGLGSLTVETVRLVHDFQF